MTHFTDSIDMKYGQKLMTSLALMYYSASLSDSSAKKVNFMPTIQLLHLVYGQLIRPQVKIRQLDVILSSYNKMYQTLSYMYDEADTA